MTPDYEKAAIKATETLIRYQIGTAPVDPLPILKKTPGCLVLTFDEVSGIMNVNRRDFLSMMGCENQDAVTTMYLQDDHVHYVVTYNKLLPSIVRDRALARELGHIVLGHDGSRPEDVRQEEARCFAHHLLCPRPLIHSIQAASVRITVEMLENMTGFGDLCLSCMRKQPAVHVPADLNRQVRDLFMPYILNLFDYYRHAAKKDGSALADFGNYMEGYEE